MSAKKKSAPKRKPTTVTVDVGTFTESARRTGEDTEAIHWDDRPQSEPQPAPRPLDPGPSDWANAMTAEAKWSPPILEVRRSTTRVLQAGIDTLFEDLQAAEYSIKRLQERLRATQDQLWRHRQFLSNVKDELVEPAPGEVVMVVRTAFYRELRASIVTLLEVEEP